MAKHKEYELQVQVVKYLRNKGWIVFSIPNERNLGVSDALRMRASGLTKGAPDLVAWLPTGYGYGIPYWFELKTQEGRRSPEQECMEDVAKDLDVNYKVIRKLEDLPCYQKEEK